MTFIMRLAVEHAGASESGRSLILSLRASIEGTNSATYSYLADSPLVSQITFAQSGTTRMTTTKQYDYLNRLTSISSANASATVLDAHNYVYNSANQRTSATNVDGTYWVYQYDALGQVVSGVKYWSDGSVVAGQQFGYGFDNIGNRQTTTAGGDQWGANLRFASYTVNSLNQYTSRTVPGAVDVIGSATNTATVTVNNLPTTRKGNYYRAQVPMTNTAGPAWQTMTNLAVLNQGTNDVLQTNLNGNFYLPQTPEAFTYDADGNLTNDGRWIYTWDAENRLVAMTNNANVPTGARMGLAFVYDVKGRRISKSVTTNAVTSTLAFIYDGWNLLVSLNSSSSVNEAFTWGLDLSGSMQGAGGVGGLLWLTQPSVQTAFYSYDGNGNVAALVNAANGTVSANYEYGPFGEVIRATGPMAKLNPFRFSTKYQDDESDLVYYNYRYLNASTGRWLSMDPMGEPGFELSRDPTEYEGLDSDGDWPGYNSDRPDLYIFVKNDPIDAYDVNGLLDSGQCVVATEAAATVAVGVAALPAEAIVLGVVIVGEGVVITYELCTKSQCGCPECKPYKKGTIGYLGPHKTKRSAPPTAPRPTHYNLFQVRQQPSPSCHCFWNRMSPHYSAVPGQVDLNQGFPTLTP